MTESRMELSALNIKQMHLHTTKTHYVASLELIEVEGESGTLIPHSKTVTGGQIYGDIWDG